jgi:hypothetical protein
MPAGVRVEVKATMSPIDVVTAIRRMSMRPGRKRKVGRAVYKDPPRVDWRKFHRLVASFIVAMDEESMSDDVTRALWKYCEKRRSQNRREIGRDWE